MMPFLATLYVLLCEGFIIGTLMDNDEIPDVVKFLFTIFAVIFAPIFFGVSLGLLIFKKLNRK